LNKGRLAEVYEPEFRPELQFEGLQLTPERHQDIGKIHEIASRKLFFTPERRVLGRDNLRAGTDSSQNPR